MEALIRNTVKAALGSPVSTSNYMLWPGLHITLGEIAEDQRIAQREWLLGTPAGRYISQSMGESEGTRDGARLYELTVNISANIVTKEKRGRIYEDVDEIYFIPVAAA